VVCLGLKGNLVLRGFGFYLYSLRRDAVRSAEYTTAVLSVRPSVHSFVTFISCVKTTKFNIVACKVFRRNYDNVILNEVDKNRWNIKIQFFINVFNSSKMIQDVHIVITEN